MNDTKNRKPAKKGQAFADIDTPALVIDLDAFENNLARMADTIKQFPVRLRAHAKTHKSPIIAARQMALGAVGACCQKVSEAEILVRGGVPNVLVSNQVIGEQKLARLAALGKDAEWIGLCVDSELGITQAAQAASQADIVLNVLVEIDVGAGRCGVPPGEPVRKLAQMIASDQNLSFAGLQAYHGGAQHIRDHKERRSAIDATIAMTHDTVALLKEHGLECEIVGGAGTGTFEMEAASGVYTELQAGSYIFMDADYARNKDEDGKPIATFEHALFVLTTVMSRPGENRAVVDAGHKAAAIDSGMPTLFERPGLSYEHPSDEHGVLRITGSNKPPELGEKVLLIPGHCDPTVNLHDWYVCVRGLRTQNATVEDVWPVAARGAYF